MRNWTISYKTEVLCVQKYRSLVGLALQLLQETLDW